MPSPNTPWIIFGNIDPMNVKSLSFYSLDKKTKGLLKSLREFLKSLGDDVWLSPVEGCISFNRNKNFASVEIHPTEKMLAVFVNGDRNAVKPEKGFLMDVSGVPHKGTGSLLILIRSEFDIIKAKPLLVKSYEVS